MYDQLIAAPKQALTQSSASGGLFRVALSTVKLRAPRKIDITATKTDGDGVGRPEEVYAKKHYAGVDRH